MYKNMESIKSKKKDKLDMLSNDEEKIMDHQK